MNLHDLTHKQRKLIKTMESHGIRVDYPVTAKEAAWANKACFEVCGFLSYSWVDLVPNTSTGSFKAYTRHGEVYDVNGIEDMVEIYRRCRNYTHLPIVDDCDYEVPWEKLLNEYIFAETKVKEQEKLEPILQKIRSNDINMNTIRKYDYLTKLENGYYRHYYAQHGEIYSVVIIWDEDGGFDKFEKIAWEAPG